MPLLGPGVGEVDNDLVQGPRQDQVPKGEGALAVVEADVGEALAAHAAKGPEDAGRRDLGPEDEPVGARPGELRREAAVAEADLQDQGAFPAEEVLHFGRPAVEAGGHDQHGCRLYGLRP